MSACLVLAYVYDHQGLAVLILKRVLKQAGKLAFTVGRCLFGLELSVGEDGEDSAQGGQVFVNELGFSLDVVHLS